MKKINVAFCSAEVYPFAKTGGLADVSGALPLALGKQGVKVNIFMPRYKGVNPKGIKRVGKHLSKLKLNSNVSVYFIEHKNYFNRSSLYGHAKGEYRDNFKRFRYYCLTVLESIKKYKIKTDIVHCHDWHAGLIPVYLKGIYKDDSSFKSISSILTIHNLAYQGVYKASVLTEKERPQTKSFEFYGRINLLRAGIIHADYVTTVGKLYAKEILTKRFGCGLEKDLRKKKVQGILNGIDTKIWNPSTDSLIKVKYSKKSFLAAKAKNKQDLQKRFNLPQCPNTPVFGFVGRLDYQKGIDLILKSLSRVLKNDVQIIIQGIGSLDYQHKLHVLARKYSNKLGVCTAFSEKTAHQIYAGSDLFLMPSVFEPCGLSQLISFRYGTIPVVSKTGGLVDTVQPSGKKKNGFMMKGYSPAAFESVISEAAKYYSDNKKFKRLIENAINTDFSWEQSAKRYKKLYTCV